MQLVKYEAACRAVAEAKSVDEVKNFMAGAQAARAYARQAKNRQLELDALEIRVRAERRLGEIIGDLKNSRTLKKQGRRQTAPLKLSDLGIDSDDSGRAQRLAAIPADKFASELIDWRRASEVAQRIEVPLQHIRLPSIRADRQRASARKGRTIIDGGDPFAKYVAIDGRRIVDWRIGELARLEVGFRRLANAAAVLRQTLPIANADPLATVESTFKGDELSAALQSVWETLPVGNAGLAGSIMTASLAARTRVCGHCKRQFVMRSIGQSAGRFCSRPCAFAFRRKH